MDRGSGCGCGRAPSGLIPLRFLFGVAVLAQLTVCRGGVPPDRYGAGVREVQISAEVAAVLGGEQCARLRGEDWNVRVQCWDCDGWLEPDDPAVVLVLAPDDDVAGGVVEFAVHAHCTCARSEIRRLAAAELKARRDGRGTETDGSTDIQMVATVWDTGRGTAYPAVLISYNAEMMFNPGSVERIDAIVTALLAQGWHLVTDLSAPAPAGPAGWQLRFTHDEGHASAPGLLELIEPGYGVVTAAHVEPARLWRPAVLRTGTAVVIHGSRYLTEWQTRGRTAVKRAARSGALVGGIIPVTLHGPGNTGA